MRIAITSSVYFPDSRTSCYVENPALRAFIWVVLQTKGTHVQTPLSCYQLQNTRTLSMQTAHVRPCMATRHATCVRPSVNRHAIIVHTHPHVRPNVTLVTRHAIIVGTRSTAGLRHIIAVLIRRGGASTCPAPKPPIAGGGEGTRLGEGRGSVNLARQLVVRNRCPSTGQHVFVSTESPRLVVLVAAQIRHTG